jgi:hypothetical protein
MSKRFGKSIFASTALAVIAVSVTSFALANIPTGSEDENLAVEEQAETSVPAAAVQGAPLFADEQAGPRCVAEADVLTNLDLDRAKIGGEMVTLETGFDQAFADEWRRETDLGSVRISAVYAHIFSNQSGFGMVDVVELGSDGCAISRTLLTEQEWNELLAKAAGVAVYGFSPPNLTARVADHRFRPDFRAGWPVQAPPGQRQ